MDIKKVAAAINADVGFDIPELELSLSEMEAIKQGAGSKGKPLFESNEVELLFGVKKH